PATRPSRSHGAIRPHPARARLTLALGTAPAAQPTVEGPRSMAPSRTASPRPPRALLNPAPIALKPLDIARLPEAELVAIPRAPKPSAPRVRRRSAAAPNRSPTAKIEVVPAPLLPQPMAVPLRTTRAISQSAH